MEKSTKSFDYNLWASLGILLVLVLMTVGRTYEGLSLGMVFMAVCFGCFGLHQVARIWMHVDMRSIIPKMHYVISKDDAFRFVSGLRGSDRVMFSMMLAPEDSKRYKTFKMLLEFVICILAYYHDQTLICAVYVVAIFTFKATEDVRCSFSDEAHRIYDLSKEK